MDGFDQPSSTTAEPQRRTDASAMFFVVFGLVYETLSGSYAETSKNPHAAVSQVALRAMRNFVLQEYSGSALLEPTIFNELLSLWYRIAITEPPAVQIRLVETLNAFATSHPSSSDT